MIIDCGDIDLCIPGNLPDGGILETFFAKDNAGRIEDPCLGRRFVISHGSPVLNL
jgi:hypothetical protein